MARALLAFVLVTSAAVPFIYWIAVTLAPPITPDGHRVMPIGQVGMALMVGPLLGLLAGLLAGQRGRLK